MQTLAGDLRGAQADSRGVSQGPNGDSVVKPAQERNVEESEPRQSPTAAGVTETGR